MTCGGHLPAQGKAVLLLLLVFARLVCLVRFRLVHLVLLAGVLVAQGMLLPRAFAAGV